MTAKNIELKTNFATPVQLSTAPVKIKTYTAKSVLKSGLLDNLTEQQKFELKVVSSILPFKVNNYVLSELVDLENPSDCQMFRLVFPLREMLEERHYQKMAEVLASEPTAKEIATASQAIRKQLNPHPGLQQTMNVPKQGEQSSQGLQHKYTNTVLFFPSQGQTCHSYCTFCFRWAQFVGKDDRFASNDREMLVSYLAENKQVSDLLMTGGDPMVMRADKIRHYLEVFINNPELEHISNIRIGTKSLTFWPHRYTSDPDSDALLELLKELVEAGKHVSIMIHVNHWKEMQTPAFAEAVKRLKSTGVTLRSQAPLLANINDDPAAWSKMWEQQVAMGIIPYYMFVERDTGAKKYFEVSLAKAWKIYKSAMSSLTGLARTVRGPSMSCGPGKVEILGVNKIADEKVFVLRFIQARNPDWCYIPFYAQYDESACWFDELKPAFGKSEFFFTEEYQKMKLASCSAQKEESIIV